MEYQGLNDYELLNYVAENIEEANDIIVDKYRPLVISICNKMAKYINNCGIDRNDLIQEGMLGLTNAICYFKDQKEATFYTYATTCIKRKVISAIVTANRQKHKILNESISYDDPDLTNDKFLKDSNYDPLQIITNSDSKDNIEGRIKAKLTPLETQVFELMLSGFKYKEIADILDKDIKSIDNAIQRIRHKAKNTLCI